MQTTQPNYEQEQYSIMGARVVITERNGETVDVHVTDPTVRNEIGAKNAIEDGSLPVTVE